MQRVWIALEAKNLDYQYIEVDPYKKPQSLLEVNPQGLVPALRHGEWACYESTVLIEYASEFVLTCRELDGLTMLSVRRFECRPAVTATRRSKETSPLPLVGRSCKSSPLIYHNCC